jgi:cobalt-precorrin 5A hydrolase
VTLAIIAITSGGARLGTGLRERLDGADLFVPAKHAGEAGEGAIVFSVELKELVRQLWPDCRGFVFIMATGIVVRILAPHLRGKDLDPAVVVMDEAGAFAVSLLSGHLGGANELARKLAEASGGQAVITTATDVNGLPAWDEVARREGLRIEPVKNIRRLNSLLLQGERIVLVDRRRRISRHFASVPGVVPVANFAAAQQVGAAGKVFVTHRHIPHLEAQDDLLVLRPRDLVVGIGCNRGTPAEEIEEAVERELRRAFLSPHSIACLATIDVKADEEGLNLFAKNRGIPVEHYSAEALNSVSAPAEPSPHALAAVGAKGVCEPAALLSAGSDTLLIKKKICGNVTVAVAEKQ